MAAPWEKYATATAEAPDPAESPLPPWKRHAQAQGPWSRYQGAAPAEAAPASSPGVLTRINAGLTAAVAPISEKIAEVTAPLKEGAAPGSVKPADTAPARAGISQPSEDLDQKALFERRAKLRQGTPEYDELTRKIARAQTQRAEGAALFAAPAGKGIAGLVERALPKAGKEAVKIGAEAA